MAAIISGNHPFVVYVFAGASMIACIWLGMLIDADIGEVGFYAGMAYGLLALAMFVYITATMVVEVVVESAWSLIF